jgi:hypothetical protein
MHPEIARALATQHHDELVRGAARARSPRLRRLPRWHVSWTRTVLAPATLPGAAVGRSGQADGRGSSLMIIISAHRPA